MNSDSLTFEPGTSLPCTQSFLTDLEKLTNGSTVATGANTCAEKAFTCLWLKKKKKVTSAMRLDSDPGERDRFSSDEMFSDSESQKVSFT